MTEDAEKTDTIQSVALAFNILEALADANSGLGVTALALELETSKSRIHRHLRSLVNLGYLRQSPATERYTFGPRLAALGRAAAGLDDLTSVVKPFIHQLRETTGLAVSVGQVESDGVRILTTIPGTHQIDVAVRPGSLLGHFKSAQGLVSMAYLPAERRAAILEHRIGTDRTFTPPDPDQLEAQLARITAQGWVDAPNLAMRGLNALACPILGPDGAMVATLALVSLTEHIPTPPAPEQIEALQTAASGISDALSRLEL